MLAGSPFRDLRFLSYEKLIAFAAILTASLSFGLSYAIDNQNTYLLAPLNYLDPTFLSNDWLTTKTTHYHSSFTYLISLINGVLPLPIGTVLVNLISILIGIASLVRISEKVANPKEAWIVIAIMLSLIVAGRSASIAGSYLYQGYLQPSGIATTFFCLALLMWLKNRWLGFAVCIAASGVFHANFLIVGILLGVVLVVISRGDSKEQFCRLLIVAAPTTVVLIGYLPTLLAVAQSPGANEGQWIFHNIRSPHHYLPQHFWRSIVPFIGWHLLFWGALGLARTSNHFIKRLALINIGLFIPVIVATLIGLIYYDPTLAQLYLWRLAPFALITSQIGFAALAWSMYDEPYTIKSIRINYLFLAIILIGVSMVIGYSLLRVMLRPDYPFSAHALQSMLILATILPFFNNSSIRNMARHLIAITALAILFNYSWNSVMRSNVLWGSRVDPSVSELIEWSKTTSRDSTFLIPPDLDFFRLQAARAVVVDWKSTPIVGDEVREWYRRINRISGRTVRTIDEAKLGYQNLAVSDVESIVSEFDVDYVVVSPITSQSIQRDWTIPFQNNQFMVLDTRNIY